MDECFQFLQQPISEVFESNLIYRLNQFVEIKITSFDAQQVLTLVEMEMKYKDNFQVLLLLDTFRKSHKLIIDEVLGKFELNT